MSGSTDDEQDGVTIEDFPNPGEVSPEHTATRQDSTRYLMQSLARLDEREQHIIRTYYGLDDNGPKSLALIGRELGLSGERVRQLQKASIARLRNHLMPNREDLEPLLAS